MTTETPRKKQISVSLPAELLDRIRVLAAKKQARKQAIYRDLLEIGLRAVEDPPEPIIMPIYMVEELNKARGELEKLKEEKRGLTLAGTALIDELVKYRRKAKRELGALDERIRAALERGIPDADVRELLREASATIHRLISVPDEGTGAFLKEFSPPERARMRRLVKRFPTLAGDSEGLDAILRLMRANVARRVIYQIAHDYDAGDRETAELKVGLYLSAARHPLAVPIDRDVAERDAKVDLTGAIRQMKLTEGTEVLGRDNVRVARHRRAMSKRRSRSAKETE